jgi:hypothetical protein
MRNPKFDALLEEIRQLHEHKNHDYSEDRDPLSNLRSCQKLGVTPFMGVLIRMTDKWARIEQLVQGKTPKNESVRDSLIDLAVYGLLGVLLLDELVAQWEQERAGDKVPQRRVVEVPPPPPPTRYDAIDPSSYPSLAAEQRVASEAEVRRAAREWQDDYLRRQRPKAPGDPLS